MEDEIFVAIHDIDEWSDFWNENSDSLSDEFANSASTSGCTPERFCFLLACNCSLIVGGGAAPLFRIGFVD